jgi:hypothetical protein
MVFLTNPRVCSGHPRALARMGCTSSKPTNAEDKDALKQNASIDKMLRMDKKKFDRTIKILLLGMHTPEVMHAHLLCYDLSLVDEKRY